MIITIRHFITHKTVTFHLGTLSAKELFKADLETLRLKLAVRYESELMGITHYTPSKSTPNG